MTIRKAPVGVVALFLLAAGAAAANAEGVATDWPQFRGSNRDGSSTETGLSDGWPQSGPPELWRIEIGEGYSGIAVVDSRLYTMYAADDQGQATEFLAAFDATSGEELWRTAIGDKLDTEFGNGPRATPTVDGDTVYAMSSYGDLAALAASDGAVHWQIKIMETFGSQLPTWGFSMSALVDGDQLIVEGGGGEGKSYAALDKKTGEVLWTSGDGQPGHNSPIAVEMMGETRYVYVAGGKLRCIDQNGDEVWAHDWPRGETHASPVYVAPDMIYASGAEGVGATMVKVDESSEQAKTEELWKVPHLRNHFSTAVAHDGHIYGFDNATLKSVSVATGEMNWAKRGLGKGSLIYADGHFYVLSDRGILTQIEATPTAYSEKSRYQALNGKSWTSPTLSNGTLYLRNHTEMIALDVNG